MREDVADRYAQMNRERREIEYHPLPELRGGAGSSGEIPQPGRRRSSDADADFELAGSFAGGASPAAEDDEDEFTLGEAAEDDGGTYAVAGLDDAAESAKDGAEAASARAEAAVAESGDEEKPEGADAVSHSEATGGDVLLDIAMQEETRNRGGRRRGLVLKGDKILLHCPAGHPVKVARKHSGKVGRCPHPGCGLRYLVPDVPPEPVEEESGAVAESGVHAPATAPSATGSPTPAGPPDELAVGAFTRYLDGVRMHTVVPGKVKAKADSQAKAFQEVDVLFSPDTLLVVTMEGKSGVFGLGGEKPAQVREKVRQHLGGDEPDLSALPVPHVLLAGANAGEVAVEYPSDLLHETKFNGEPVFGTGRIALRLPRTGGEPDADQPPEKQETRFLSMTLSQFRRFAAAMEEFGFASGPGNRYAAGTPIPRTDDAPVHAGHYTDAPVPELPRPDLYLADPKLNAVIAGYRCQGCGLIVSEDGRKKEKLGGANGKGLAKAKCPKCDKPFGRQPLYKLATP